MPQRKHNLQWMVAPIRLVQFAELLTQGTGGDANDRIDVRIEIGFPAAQGFDGNRILPNVVGLAFKILIANPGEKSNQVGRAAELGMAQDTFEFLAFLTEFVRGRLRSVGFMGQRTLRIFDSFP
jgi:hypothetical protein